MSRRQELTRFRLKLDSLRPDANKSVRKTSDGVLAVFMPELISERSGGVLQPASSLLRANYTTSDYSS